MQPKKTKKIEVRVTAKRLREVKIAAKRFYGGNVSKFMEQAITRQLAHEFTQMATTLSIDAGFIPQEGPYETT